MDLPRILKLVWKTVRILEGYGIKRGDRIATVSHNHAETVVQYFAAWTLGAVVVPINLGETDERVEYILSNSETKLAFVREPYISRIEALQAKLPEFRTIVQTGGELSSKYLHYSVELNNHSGDAQSVEDVGLEDEVLIVYTSGTTGNPKGVVLVQQNLLDGRARDFGMARPDGRAADDVRAAAASRERHDCHVDDADVLRRHSGAESEILDASLF